MNFVTVMCDEYLRNFSFFFNPLFIVQSNLAATNEFMSLCVCLGFG